MWGQNRAWATAFGRRDNTIVLKSIEKHRGAAVANAEATLQECRGSFARAYHLLFSPFIQFVIFPIFCDKFKTSLSETRFELEHFIYRNSCENSRKY